MSSRITPPSADTGAGPGRRWTLVLAAVALVAIVGCLIYLLVARDSDDGATPPPASEPTGLPSTPSEPSTTASTPPASTRCSLPPGNQAVPNTPIHGAQWSLVNRIAVPESPAFGPQRTDGLRRCFAHSPTGAVYAAYNHIAAMSPVDDPTGEKAIAVLTRIMTPGPNRDRYFDYLRTAAATSGSGSGASVQLAGFKVLDATANRATILIAGQNSSTGGYASSTWTLVWQGDDWKVLAPKPGERAGDPYTTLNDLTGFVPWRGA